MKVCLTRQASRSNLESEEFEVINYFAILSYVEKMQPPCNLRGDHAITEHR